MRIDKERARVLRLKGYSYSEINKKLGVPKATLSDWFSELMLPEQSQKRIQKRVQKKSIDGLIKRNKLQTHLAQKRASEIRTTAQKEIKKISKQELLLIGAALYWGEGHKKLITKGGRERTYHSISFSNTDPIMIQVFIQFLKTNLGIPVDKMRVGVRIFQHINEQHALDYWKHITGIPSQNFQKVYYGVSKSSEGKRPFNRLPYGTIQIRVGDTKSFQKIMGWINGIKKQFK
ncbi:hypothetical protein BK004_03595 [bacterium CG10_46_32]|nr:MAG: hypothetical protein BK004_03595 [bacterium CG10_46_32]PIR55884.1 MAG: hypothetical protein COU73_03625 [Parcubacteria group bacterium CG10_big_fil_rev_8_21_14_0_10_46_32]